MWTPPCATSSPWTPPWRPGGRPPNQPLVYAPSHGHGLIAGVTIAAAAPASGRRAYRLVRPLAAAPPPHAPDPEQARVIAHEDGPLLVIGAPGTGKTRTLIESVAARVADGTPPDRVLVL